MKKITSLLIAIAMSSIALAQNKEMKGGDIPFIDAAPYDTLMENKKVALYTITDGKVGAQISNYGGFIITLFAPDKNGNYNNLVTSYADIHKYMTYNLGQVGPALGRFANRITNAHFELDGQSFDVTKNSRQHILHGGLKGFDHTVWDVVSHNKNELVLKCTLADGLDGFPGNLTTTLTYSISDGGLKIYYAATTDKKTIVNLSNHAYFNLNGTNSDGDIMEHMLTIEADSITETNREGIPSGKLLAVDSTPYDFRKPCKIGDRQMVMKGFQFGQKFEIPEGKVMMYDNNFCLRHTKKGKVEKVATLYSPQSGITMEVWNDHPGLQVYTGARKAIALESQMYPDSPNHPEFPSTTLAPGEQYTHTCIYKFSAK